MTETHSNEQENYGPPLIDVFVCALGALVIGGVVWAGGYGIVVGIDYAAQQFGVYPPANALINTAIRSAYVVGPILAGLLAAWRSYRFLLNLD